MKITAMIVLVPLVISACTTSKLPTQELRALKPACAAGDFGVCSDIGHKVRRSVAEADYLASK